MKLPINGKIGPVESTESLILVHNNIQISKKAVLNNKEIDIKLFNSLGQNSK